MRSSNIRFKYTVNIEATTYRAVWESGRTLNELLRSLIWELELSCYPIPLSPERTTRLAQDSAKSHALSRRLFDHQDDSEKLTRERRPLMSSNYARIAPDRRIKLITPPADDPYTIRRATWPQQPSTNPRGPSTRYLSTLIGSEHFILKKKMNSLPFSTEPNDSSLTTFTLQHKILSPTGISTWGPYHRKLTISNFKISKLPQSKKFKFTNLKIPNSETSHLQIIKCQNTIFKSDLKSFQHFFFRIDECNIAIFIYYFQHIR